MYEQLIKKSEEYLEKARKCKEAKQADLAEFYFNASKGFEMKAKSLQVEQA